MENNGQIQFVIQKENPTLPAREYNIKTVKDIFDAVTNENIDKFMSEFKMVLKSGLLLRNIQNEKIKSGELSDETPDIVLEEFYWIDD